MTVALRPFDRADMPALLPLSTANVLRQLFDPPHAAGGNAVVAVRDGEIVGVAGWVFGERELFGAPVLAADPEAAEALVDMLVTLARGVGAARLRIGCGDEDSAKRRALDARGFSRAFDFITLTCSAESRAVPAIELVWAPIGEVDPDVLCALHDETFAGIDNTAPMSLDEARHVQATACPGSSGVWFDGANAVAFVIALRDGGSVEINAIGVRTAWRRKGLARALVDRTITAAAELGASEVRAMIASTNPASLALHAAAGLREHSRRAIFQYGL